MTGELSLTLAFATGLFGALHCLGMCSGLAGAYFVRHGRRGVAARLLPVLAYHASRILVYAVLGAAGAVAGRVLVQSGLIGKGQGLVMMAAGLLIIVLGLGLLSGVPLRANSRPATCPMGPRVALAGVRFSHFWQPGLMGALNGLVPCSLVFSLAAKAAATADPLRAGLLMLAFGVGTLPTMALVSLTGVVIGRRARGVFGLLAALGVIALGVWTLYEGLAFFDIMRGLANW